MPLNHLEHFLVFAKDIEITKAFYIQVLGLTEGYRPAFEFPGYWLYLNNIPVVHLVQENSTNKAQATYLAKNKSTMEDIGAIDHIAFNASNFKEMLDHFNHLGIIIRLRIVPEEDGTHQIFILDPNGIGIELNFRGK